jgi:hypothetical protein
MRKLVVLLLAPLVLIAAADPRPTNPFVHYCQPNRTLCASGKTMVVHGGTGYGAYDDPSSEIALAAQLRVNVFEISEFQTQHHSYADALSDATWQRVDKAIAAFKRAGKHVILNLSEFAWDELARTPPVNPLTVDNGWSHYIAWIANRTNTVTRIKYKDEPAIAMVEIWGEPCYLREVDHRCPAAVTQSASYTTAAMGAFYTRTMANWHADAPKILVSSGGLSHLNGTDNPAGVSNGIPYHQIFHDVHNASCDMEINSPNDLNVSVAKVTSYCATIGKPWFLAAWSSCYHSSYWENSQWGDKEMAAHARLMYDVSNARSRASYPALGADFWNMRDEGAVAGVCGIAPGPFPMTAEVVRAQAR